MRWLILCLCDGKTGLQPCCEIHQSIKARRETKLQATENRMAKERKGILNDQKIRRLCAGSFFSDVLSAATPRKIKVIERR